MADDRTSWFLTADERANPRTVIDAAHEDGRAWSSGNRVRPLVHGATYFRELYDRLRKVGSGDLVLFVDWRGDSDEQLIGEPGSEIHTVIADAARRGADVRGLVWRSHTEKANFSAEENRAFIEEVQEAGAEVLLDMRVRVGGSHHQKFVVIRYADDPRHDIAFVGGIDLCHSRRDDSDHRGDPQPQPMAAAYGPTPPWHDLHTAIQGPAVHTVETVFRERWDDPTPLTKDPIKHRIDVMRGNDVTPDPLPVQQPPPPPVEGGTHDVQILRTYPNLRKGTDYRFARGGERSVARGFAKASGRAQRLIYLEDQYFWSHDVGGELVTALEREPDLHVMVVLPPFPDQDGTLAKVPQLVGRHHTMTRMLETAPDRVAFYSLENHDSEPVYVHAKVCVIDDLWTTIGSDNLNRRSWTHDSEISCTVVDRAGDDHSAYARRVRLLLAGEHLDRIVEDGRPGDMSALMGAEREPAEVDAALHEALADCLDPVEAFEVFAQTAARLDAWHAGGRRGDRPPGRLRSLAPPDLPRWKRELFHLPYSLLHDPDGRPAPLRRRGGY